MTWQYRVVRNKDADDYFQIHEIYYEHGKVVNWSDPIAPGGNDPEELQRDLALMLRAFDLPIIRAEAILDTPAPPGTLRDEAGRLIEPEKTT